MTLAVKKDIKRLRKKLISTCLNALFVGMPKLRLW